MQFNQTNNNAGDVNNTGPVRPAVHPWTAERFQDATRDDLLRVVAAADRLYQCEAEFEDDRGACGEHKQELDDAIRACPGTRAYHFDRSNDAIADEATTVP